MQPLVAFLLILFGFSGLQALAYPCATDLEAVKPKRLLHDWMSRFKGAHTLSGCKVEITVCNPLEPRTDNQVLAEIYIVDYRKREAYLPLTIVARGNPKIRTSLETYAKTLFYLKWDYFYEKEHGQTETYRLEVKQNSVGTALESIDLGTYSTNKALNLPDTDSRWYNCGKSFDDEEN